MAEPRADNCCPYCGGNLFEGVDRQRGEDDWVNKCLGCEDFCIYVTADHLTYGLVDPSDENSEIDYGGN